MALARGMSPYATGGGGVTFERKVAVQYLAHLLVGDAVRELGDGRRIVSVAFQQAPDYPVDDLVVSAGHPDELEPSLVLAVAVRRSPKLVSSDESTQKLVRALVDAVLKAPTDGPEHRWCLVVAGPQSHAEQLATLADLAAVQMDAPGFFDLVRTRDKFDASVRVRRPSPCRTVMGGDTCTGGSYPHRRPHVPAIGLADRHTLCCCRCRAVGEVAGSRRCIGGRWQHSTRTLLGVGSA